MDIRKLSVCWSLEAVCSSPEAQGRKVSLVD